MAEGFAGEREDWAALEIENAALRRQLAERTEELRLAAAGDADARKQQQRLEEVMRELDHRSKNLLAVVQSIARQTALGAETPEAFLPRFSERLQSLADAHAVLVRSDWRSADLREVIEAQLRHYRPGPGRRVRLEGEPFQLPPETAHYVGLALHELGSNAAKYGALSNRGGRVEISWTVLADEDGVSRLNLRWSESGGPKVGASDRHGFGRTILEVLTPRALRGEAELMFLETGLVWTLTAPVAR